MLPLSHAQRATGIKELSAQHLLSPWDLHAEGNPTGALHREQDLQQLVPHLEFEDFELAPPRSHSGHRKCNSQEFGASKEAAMGLYGVQRGVEPKGVLVHISQDRRMASDGFVPQSPTTPKWKRDANVWQPKQQQQSQHLWPFLPRPASDPQLHKADADLFVSPFAPLPPPPSSKYPHAHPHSRVTSLKLPEDRSVPCLPLLDRKSSAALSKQLLPGGIGAIGGAGGGRSPCPCSRAAVAPSPSSAKLLAASPFDKWYSGSDDSGGGMCSCLECACIDDPANHCGCACGRPPTATNVDNFFDFGSQPFAPPLVGDWLAIQGGEKRRRTLEIKRTNLSCLVPSACCQVAEPDTMGAGNASWRKHRPSEDEELLRYLGLPLRLATSAAARVPLVVATHAPKGAQQQQQVEDEECLKPTHRHPAGAAAAAAAAEAAATAAGGAAVLRQDATTGLEADRCHACMGQSKQSKAQSDHNHSCHVRTNGGAVLAASAACTSAAAGAGTAMAAQTASRAGLLARGAEVEVEDDLMQEEADEEAEDCGGGSLAAPQIRGRDSIEVGLAVFSTAEEERTPARMWQFEVQASLACSDRLLGASDVIGAIDFDYSSQYFATGGIARKIRVYSLAKLQLASEELQESSHGLGHGYGRESHYRRGLRGDRCEEDNEDDDDDDVEEEELQRMRRRRKAMTRRKRKSGVFAADGVFMHAPVMDHEDCSEAIVCTPAKLSSVKWVPGSRSLVGCGDYDGVVAEWDLQKGLTVCERDEHSGQRVWSLDYSRASPHLCASASDDGTVRLWSAPQEDSAGVIRVASRRPVCCAEFAPGSDRLLALACADSHVYMYDLRSMGAPLVTLAGHSRAASYTRFAGPGVLASASVDSTIRIWDVSAYSQACSGGGSSASWQHGGAAHRQGGGQVELGYAVPPSSTAAMGNGLLSGGLSRAGAGAGAAARCVLRAHQNVRNFVGLSVKGEGRGALIATGSESNEVVVYQTGVAQPVLSMDFATASSSAAFAHHPAPAAPSGKQQAFVSSVCWRQEPSDCTLVAANSEGVVRVIRGSPVTQL
eukprot:jgi/Mesen1/4757/ME000242S03932